MDNTTKEYLTVREFSEAAGVSKQAIYSQVDTRLKPYVKKTKKGLKISAAALEELEFKVPVTLEKDQVDSKVENKLDSQVESKVDNQVDNAVENPSLISAIEKTLEALTRELEEKNKQLESKDRQIEALNDRLAEAYKTTKDLSALIDQQQKLSLVDKAAAAKDDKAAETIVEAPAADIKEDIQEGQQEQKKSIWKRIFGD